MPQTHPKSPQDPPKMPQIHPKSPLSPPNLPQIHLKPPQDPPKPPQDPPKSPQDPEEPPPKTGLEPPGEEPQALARRLFRLDGVRKSQVAAFLRKDTEFSAQVAREYLELFQFQGLSLEQALRQFLRALVLSGETQERERVLGHFSRRFHRCNPGAFPSADSVHTLTCALMLLNTDLHGQRLGRAMSSSEFVTNLSGLMDGQDFPREQLKALYGSIRSRKLEWATDDEDEPDSQKTKKAPKFPNPEIPPEFLGGPGPARRGVLARKVLAESDGKKAPWGRRGWKRFRAELRGPLLALLRDPPEGPEELLGLPHAHARPHPQYSKRPHVFLLRTGDRREFLCQAQSAQELSQWVFGINVAAALCSAPPFPAAVGSRRRFVRPILPSAPSRCTPEQQQARLRHWLGTVTCQLLEHQRLLPEGRGREQEEHRAHGDFLRQERQRCLTYVQALGAWLGGDSGDSAALGDSASAERPPEPAPLTKCHSSPSLVTEPPPGRVRRHISERRATRVIVPKRHRDRV
ncbi:PH and SEC7 domain-containing protein 4-like isoform X2 [Zonotrichia albicollis]|uniref:PH and SEC7 domain-containing protein 4-like isoform X2 n=1 Tax=Zonotrichia albicollis TaxID=44394 RepID=UPI003D80CD56